MHFSVLLCHAPKYFWKDPSEVSLNSVVPALVMASTPSERVSLIIPSSLKKEKVTWRERLGK